MNSLRRVAPLALSVGLVAAVVGFAAPARATDYPWFSCAEGSGHLSTPTPVLSVAQGQTAVFTIDIERVGCPDAITFSAADYLPPASTTTFSENPTNADSITLAITTSKTWPTITPVGNYGAHIYVSTGHNTFDVYLGFELTVTASATPIAKTPTPTLGAGIVGSSTVNVRTSWSAIDPDGIRSYTVQRQVNAGSWSTVVLSSLTQTAITQALTFGATYRYRVRAIDRLGHVGSYTYGRPFKVRLVQQTSSAITSPWSFRTVYTSYASGGSLKYNPYSGSDFTYTFSSASVAWVSVRGPTRSDHVEFYVNGAEVRAPLSLYASTTQYRRIVFARNFGANGTRALYVHNLGFQGHTRLDIDAFVLLTFY
jgi:hypothetical protein